MEYILTIDAAGAEMLERQRWSSTTRTYYLLGGNPAVRLVVRGNTAVAIGDLVGDTMAVQAGVEECWGQWNGNRHLKGRRTYVVTFFVHDVWPTDQADAVLSTWLQSSYLDDDAPYRDPGGRYVTRPHPQKGR